LATTLTDFATTAKTLSVATGALATTGVRAAMSAIGDNDASRFLAQASMGANRTEMMLVRQLGYDGWLEAQFAAPQSESRWSWLVRKGFDAASNKNGQAGFDSASWAKLIASPDTLRQRIALALSEILVVGIDGLPTSWRNFAAAHYQDLLEDNAFGNYRQLLEDVTLSPAMGVWLTYRGNLKANPAKGSLPDENYAREIMQLFTIGLVRLNRDGMPALVDGAPQYTYTQADVMNLARVWTGWSWDLAGGDTSTPDFQGRPMIQYPRNHETGGSRFLGATVPAGTDGAGAMRIALDTLFNHPNVGPFIGKQLIQRLVTSNPSPGYVARVAAAFDNNGEGVRGDMKAVIRAVLLDDEARGAAAADSDTFGKLREPMLRFTQWARAFGANSPSDTWAIGNLSDPATRLGQSPLHSPSVFNFFRPGYVPPNTALGKQGLLAPEFQITNAATVIGYINFMQRVVSSGIGDVKGDYSSLLPLIDDPTALLGELNTVLAAGQVSATNLAIMVQALATMPARTNANAVSMTRIYAAILMILASPQYIAQK
jgi:uncharacterized protein (DUF1800 family)